MPPEDEKQPSKQERRAVADWISRDFTDALVASQREEGRSVVRRLNRKEYANTIEDRFGQRPKANAYLPEDGTVNGFDKVAAALPLSAAGVNGYLQMADDLCAWILRPGMSPAVAAISEVRIQNHSSTDVRLQEKPPEAMFHFGLNKNSPNAYSIRLEDGTPVAFNSDIVSPFNFYARLQGRHKIRFSVYGYQTDKPVSFAVSLGPPFPWPGTKFVRLGEALPGKPSVVEMEIPLEGQAVVRLTPLGLGIPLKTLERMKGTEAKDFRGPGLAMQWMEVVDPDSAVGDRWLTADFSAALNTELRQPGTGAGSESGPDLKQVKAIDRQGFLDTMRATFRRVGAGLYRHDLTEPELQTIVDDVARQIDAGGNLRQVFIGKIREMLVAPDFLCLVEQPGRLNDFALASRLSYFLWNSAPDEPLMAVARAGRLRDPQVLREQTERLLKDPKSQRFVSDFVSQWLGLRGIHDTTPDSVLYPEYDDYLRKR